MRYLFFFFICIIANNCLANDFNPSFALNTAIYLTTKEAVSGLFWYIIIGGPLLCFIIEGIRYDTPFTALSLTMSSIIIATTIFIDRIW